MSSSSVMAFYLMAKTDVKTSKWNTTIIVEKNSRSGYEWRCSTFYDYESQISTVQLKTPEDIYNRLRPMLRLLNTEDGDKYDYLAIQWPGFPSMRFNTGNEIDSESIMRIAIQVVKQWPVSHWNGKYASHMDLTDEIDEEYDESFYDDMPALIHTSDLHEPSVIAIENSIYDYDPTHYSPPMPFYERIEHPLSKRQKQK